jgi:hypothetical protein
MNEFKQSRDEGPTATNFAAMTANFIWPLSRSARPDEMNTSFGPRIDADQWDFHDGIDLPSRVGTPVFAMKAGKVFLAGPGEPQKGIGSRHVVVKTSDTTGETIYLVYLHLDSIATGVIVGAEVSQGELLGTVGEDDATYPHLHFEFRKGSFSEKASIHPLSYLPYDDTNNFTVPILDRFNRSKLSVAVRLIFEADSKLQGDLLRVELDLLENGNLLEGSSRVVKFDDKSTINEGKGDNLRFNDRDVAVEGYQKSDMIKDGRASLNYGIVARNVPLECDSLQARLFDIADNLVATSSVSIPSQDGIDERIDFEDDAFPPAGWIKVTSGAGTTVTLDSSAAHSDSRGMRCVDVSVTGTTTRRAGIERSLPPGRFEWLADAWFNPIALALERSQSILLFRFTDGQRLIASAHINRGRETLWPGITVRKPDGSLKSRNSKAAIELGQWQRWKLHLLRLGTRETTAVLFLDGEEALRLNWDTVGVELSQFRVGIASIPAEASGTVFCDELHLTEATF